jgi:predicted kinase
MAGGAISRRVLARLTKRGEVELKRLRPLIEARAKRGVPCDCHGDLRLEHVYHFPERPAPGDLIAIDGIEFNERFRCIDPLSDMAFLRMDLIVHGHPDLAAAYTAAWFDASGDEEGRALLPLYTSYRAAVRGKVQGMKAAQEEVPAPERERARRRAAAFWLLALSMLEPPERKPCLVLMAGLPGTGKSTLARALARRAGFTVIRTDVVRKEMAGRARRPGEDLYTENRLREVYDETRHRAEAAIFEGRRVLVDASFHEEARRLEFKGAAGAWAVPFVILHCVASPAMVRERLASRRADASDADWAVYREMSWRWEAFGTPLRDPVVEVDTSRGSRNVTAGAIAALRAALTV